MKKIFLILALAALTTVFTLPMSAQVRDISCEEYIATYAPLAIRHQQEYGIPASIKMAQGILESSNGNSRLARLSNNHFGIKCKAEWKGPYVLHDDDKKDDCFRKYATIEESYVDHSKFLAERPYYKDLFKLSVTDYKGWAKGLKKAGYATAPHYAESLINIIDRYELYLLDEGTYPTYLAGVEKVTFLDMTSTTGTAAISAVAEEGSPVDFDDITVSVHEVGGHGIFLRNGVRYVVAKEGETYESLSKSLGISAKKLMRFNRDKSDAALTPGHIVYIERGGVPANKGKRHSS